MKPIYLLILALFLILAIAGCTRSIAPPPEQPPTVEAPAEGSSSITVITPETQGDAPVSSEVITGTLEAPGGISVLCAYPPEWVPYIVQEGDTLEGLAAYFGIEPGDLATANCLYASGAPLPGQTVFLPSPPNTNGGEVAGTESQPAGGESSTTGGESSTSGSESSSSSSEEASTASSEGSSSQSDNKSACKSPYTVRSGEWVYKIGRKCNISPYAIIAANHLAWPYWLRPGQVLTLPKNAPPFPGN
jgi:LysM repeat protein